MKQQLAIGIFSLFVTFPALAQNVSEEPKGDPVLEAIQKFKEQDHEGGPEVKVVLDPVGVPPAPMEKPAETPADTTESSATPVLVTGKPPEAAPVAATPETGAMQAPEEEPRKPEEGLAVRVEQLPGKGNANLAKVKLSAPFPAKPLAQAPVGWHLEAVNNAPPFTREVELSPGSKITLKIKPHLLVPDADGTQVFTIPEPGFESSQGYQQTATVGAILSNSIRQLDDDSKHLGDAIDSLQQLLLSLPKPPETSLPEPKATPVRKR